MKKKFGLFFRLTFLFVFAIGFAASNLLPPVYADGAKYPQAQEAARESIASCDNKVYKVPNMPEGLNEENSFAIPPNAEGPVIADLGLYIEEIAQINEIDNTFTVSGIMDLVWCDPRLKYEETESGAYKLFLEEDAQERLNGIWWPDIVFANGVEAREISNEELVIHENGTVDYREKFTVILEAKYDLRKFPFDKQTLQIEIESFSWDQQSLQFHVEEQFIGFSDEFEIPEWRTENVSSRIEDVMEVGDRTPFSEFLMTINVSRQFGFYIWKVLFPLVILVMMCFAVFWMDDESLSSRLGVGFTGVLTVVAYQFIATGNLPKVSYLTLMDAYIAFSFIVMVAAIFQSVVACGYYKGGDQKLALNIDKSSRYLFPLFYLVGIGLLSVIFLAVK